MKTRIKIQGLVQGVGFRPFIYLLAKQAGIKGTVANTNNGVVITTNLPKSEAEIFAQKIIREKPEVSIIHHIDIEELHSGEERYTDFSIISSRSKSDEVTQVAPDIAVCDKCLSDRQTQLYRINYPFINCTHCGPRFSIIKDLPYDRDKTTMSGFEMCPDCRQEYTDVTDRRFHAQPIACNNCGPRYYTTYMGCEYEDYETVLAITSRLLNEGKVIAAKGIGGYHLVCDATNEKAVNRLREIKQRDTKPFAVMFRNLDAVSYYAILNESEKESLKSWRRPIVLLKQHRFLASGINPGMNTLGCILPYMPLHYDWFGNVTSPALVMTSGNLSELPIAISPDEAEKQFGGKVELILHHNREIHNRVDDSVVHICNEQPMLIRRSRGYAPETFFADTETEGILAFGAEKVNTFAMGKANTIVQSQYIGDLKNWETFAFYRESLSRFRHLLRFKAKQLVCDLHPDYMSGREAEDMSEADNLPLMRVQHHHAHAVACMLEHGLDEPVIAVVWDGTGLGDDNKAWGGEFFLCDRKSYTRLSHLEYVPMPGGDKASYEPWRMAVSYLYHYDLELPDAFTDRIGKEKIKMLTSMIDKGINAPSTSGAGRLFDAFSSLLGVCDISTRQAEAPVLLEQAACDNFIDCYTFEVMSGILSSHSIFEDVLSDLSDNVDICLISAKLHNTLANMILRKSMLLLQQTGVKKIVISGGCFQNKRLTEQLMNLFAQESVPLYVPSRIPCNDSGIAVGQLAIAAARNKI